MNHAAYDNTQWGTQKVGWFHTFRKKFDRNDNVCLSNLKYDQRLHNFIL